MLPPEEELEEELDELLEELDEELEDVLPPSGSQVPGTILVLRRHTGEVIPDTVMQSGLPEEGQTNL